MKLYVGMDQHSRNTLLGIMDSPSKKQSVILIVRNCLAFSKKMRRSDSTISFLPAAGRHTLSNPPSAAWPIFGVLINLVAKHQGFGCGKFRIFDHYNPMYESILRERIQETVKSERQKQMVFSNN